MPSGLSSRIGNCYNRNWTGDKQHEKGVVFGGGAALASPAFAQSSVQLYGIVDLAYRHTTNEGTADSGSHKGSLTRMIGGGMSQSRLGINVTEDMGNGVKALANLE